MATVKNLVITEQSDDQPTLTVSNDTDYDGLHFIVRTNEGVEQASVYVSYDDMVELLDFGDQERQIQSATKQAMAGEALVLQDHCFPLEVDGDTVRIQGMGTDDPELQEALRTVVRAAKDHMAPPLDGD